MLARLNTVTFLASFLLLNISAGLPAYANGIAAWSCVNDAGSQKLILTTTSPVSASAKVSIDGTVQPAPVSVNGTTVSVVIDASISCIGKSFTITDGGVTFRVF